LILTAPSIDPGQWSGRAPARIAKPGRGAQASGAKGIQGAQGLAALGSVDRPQAPGGYRWLGIRQLRGERLGLELRQDLLATTNCLTRFLEAGCIEVVAGPDRPNLTRLTKERARNRDRRARN
jgi:hypothetical protein